MKVNFRKVLMVVAAVLLLLQLVPVDRTVPEGTEGQDFLVAVAAPEAIANLVKDACYDCHSYETKYPWYARVAPLSFWVQGHINEGREHLNFSTWTAYPAKKAAHKLEECYEEVESRNMPMKSYTWMHPEGQLDDAQVGALAQWFQQLYRSTAVVQ